MKNGLSSRQFITLALIIMLCGVLIVGRDYFLAKRAKAYEEMSLLLSQQPEQSEAVGDDEANVISSDDGDTSGKVKKIETTYSYSGRLIIPDIDFNRGFVAYGKTGNNVDQNIAIMSGSRYPNEANSNFIMAAHSGTGWNAFFTRLDQLSKGATAKVTYQGVEYTYKLNKIYHDPKHDGQVTIYKNDEVKQLTLVTCARPDYKKYYLVLVFDLQYEATV